MPEVWTKQCSSFAISVTIRRALFPPSVFLLLLLQVWKINCRKEETFRQVKFHSSSFYICGEKKKSHLKHHCTRTSLKKSHLKVTNLLTLFPTNCEVFYIMVYQTYLNTNSVVFTTTNRGKDTVQFKLSTLRSKYLLNTMAMPVPRRSFTSS